MKSSIFPESIHHLPQANIPLEGLSAYLSQGVDHQILFMEFEEDVVLPEHTHESQIGFVLKGKIDLVIDGVAHTFKQGDIYSIPKNVIHSGFIYGGYADITFFAEKERYQTK